MHTVQTHAGQQTHQPFQSSVRFQSPGDVLAASSLDALQKRAILSSWASDLFAVESCPWLRKVPGVNAALPLKDILAALRSLDDDDPPPRGGAAVRIADFRDARRRRVVRDQARHFACQAR